MTQGLIILLVCIGGLLAHHACVTRKDGAPPGRGDGGGGFLGFGGDHGGACGDGGGGDGGDCS